MLGIILGLTVIAVIVFFLLVALRPTHFCVRRSGVISAPVSVVFAHVNDLHRWQAWSPWSKLDPAAKNTFEGPSSGAGAVMRWSGNNKVGAGCMTITESRPDELIKFKLEFLKPFKATHFAEFTFEPEGHQTAVSWSMHGRNDFMGKAIGLLMNCDKMLGGQFEQGLAMLKSVAETAAK